MKKRILILIAAIAVLVAGCVPVQYRNGVEAENYPHDNLPIHDDAVIYDYAEDGEKATIKYGSSKNIEEISKYYIDYFANNETEIENQSIGTSEFEINGFYLDFLYVVKATDAIGEYEEKLFETVVEVEIEFLTEQQIAQRTAQKYEQKLIGFWEIYTEEQYNGGEAGDEIRWGFEFNVDKTYIIYILNFSIEPPELTWEITDEGKLKWYDIAAQDYLISDVVLEEHDGFLVFQLSAEEEILYLYKTDIEEYRSTIADAEDVLE